VFMWIGQKDFILVRGPVGTHGHSTSKSYNEKSYFLLSSLRE
jgi:hypothetical protein